MAESNLNTLRELFENHLSTRTDPLSGQVTFWDHRGSRFIEFFPCELGTQDYLRRLLLHTGKALSFLYPAAVERGARAIDGKKKIDANSVLKHFTKNPQFYPEVIDSVHGGSAKRQAEELLRLRNKLAHSFFRIEELSADTLVDAFRHACHVTGLVAMSNPSAEYCHTNLVSLKEQFVLHMTIRGHLHD